MNNSKFALYGFLNAAGTVIYIVLVSLLLFNGQRIFGDAHSIFIMITMLCLFVLSASVVGTLMIGRSALWYLNGAKREAVKLFLFSLIWLLVFTVAFLVFFATMIKGSL